MPFVDKINGLLGAGFLMDYYVHYMMYMFFNSFYDMDVDTNRMGVYTAQANVAISKKNLAQLVQFNMFDEFTKYDYGEQTNQRVYGNVDPPEYELKKITNRTIGLIYSKNDMWSTVEDVNFIAESLSGN